MADRFAVQCVVCGSKTNTQLHTKWDTHLPCCTNGRCVDELRPFMMKEATMSNNKICGFLETRADGVYVCTLMNEHANDVVHSFAKLGANEPAEIDSIVKNIQELRVRCTKFLRMNRQLNREKGYPIFNLAFVRILSELARVQYEIFDDINSD